MKKILIFTFIILSFSLHSQIVTRYFVEGVENVDYVTVKICADSISGINSVKLVVKKTTHKNQANINQLIDYIKNLDYPKDGPLVDKCENLTFSFTNPKFDKMKLSDKESVECIKFRLGKYNYIHINHMDTEIRRRKRIQKEISSRRGRQIYSIDWTSNSHYVLTYKRMSDDKLKSLIGKNIKVEIIKLLENDGYVYRATNPIGIVYYGVIYKSD